MSTRFAFVFAWAFALAVLGHVSPSFAQDTRPYDLAQLSPDVRSAVENARAAQTRALMAAARAQGDGAGHVRFTGVGGDTYAGECAPCGAEAPQRHGHGVLSWNDGELYVGQHAAGGAGGMKHGYGVYVVLNGEIYEGQLSADQYSGYGVRWDAQGRVRLQGLWANNALVQ